MQNTLAKKLKQVPEGYLVVGGQVTYQAFITHI